VLEKGPQFLSKVRISGGGRCNVTHACFDVRDFASRFPRGERELIGSFSRFQALDTVEWFESRGVKLKTEGDGRMFPVTDRSQTIIDCLVSAARNAGVSLVANRGVTRIVRKPEGGFVLTLSNGETVECDQLLLATGGCRTAALGDLAVSLGHSLEPPVPSLFTFHIEIPWLRELSGTAVPMVEAAVPELNLRERGPLLLTHWGLSGPVILRLSAWGARSLHALDYKFSLRLNWLPDIDSESLHDQLGRNRQSHPTRLVRNTPISPLPARLWERLMADGIPGDIEWARVSKADQRWAVQQLTQTEFPVVGKSLNKDEFVTCGGVRLRDVDFKTMESRICRGLYFAGELLDIDGITGGFNFQAAWTTGWLAGKALAA
jgi:predicted Rossmann fold flavoprotein